MRAEAFRMMMVACLVLVLALMQTSEARFQLLDLSTDGKASSHSHSVHKKPALTDVKGRLVLPLRSEAGLYGDSNTYFVKLPANQQYYSTLTSQVQHVPGATHLRRLLPVNFASNGRPARVYHWNMPLLQQLSKQQQLQARRHTPEHHPPPSSATTTTHLSKPHRVTKHAGANKKKTTDSPIYRIMRLEKHAGAQQHHDNASAKHVKQHVSR